MSAALKIVVLLTRCFNDPVRIVNLTFAFILGMALWACLFFLWKCIMNDPQLLAFVLAAVAIAVIFMIKPRDPEDDDMGEA